MENFFIMWVLYFYPEHHHQNNSFMLSLYHMVKFPLHRFHECSQTGVELLKQHVILEMMLDQ